MTRTAGRFDSPRHGLPRELVGSSSRPRRYAGRRSQKGCRYRHGSSSTLQQRLARRRGCRSARRALGCARFLASLRDRTFSGEDADFLGALPARCPYRPEADTSAARLGRPWSARFYRIAGSLAVPLARRDARSDEPGGGGGLGVRPRRPLQRGRARVTGSHVCRGLPEPAADCRSPPRHSRRGRRGPDPRRSSIANATGSTRNGTRWPLARGPARCSRPRSNRPGRGTEDS